MWGSSWGWGFRFHWLLCPSRALVHAIVDASRCEFDGAFVTCAHGVISLVILKIHQRGVQWKQGVVVHVIL